MSSLQLQRLPRSAGAGLTYRTVDFAPRRGQPGPSSGGSRTKPSAKVAQPRSAGMRLRGQVCDAAAVSRSNAAQLAEILTSGAAAVSQRRTAIENDYHLQLRAIISCSHGQPGPSRTAVDNDYHLQLIMILS